MTNLTVNSAVKKMLLQGQMGCVAHVDTATIDGIKIRFEEFKQAVEELTSEGIRFDFTIYVNYGLISVVVEQLDFLSDEETNELEEFLTEAYYEN